MFAVMKHFDLMIGIDVHTCWPPPDPKPNGPAPYLTIMFLHGLQPLTPMMAPTCLTLSGMTMQRGTDIGPGIPHIGPPSKLTPLDILLSSSVSYFGPSAYAAEGVPVAAALASVIGINANCWTVGPVPTGLVLCPTTHFTGMTLMDILFGVVSYAADVVMEQVTGAAAAVAKKRVVGPISKKLSTKLASKTAAKTAGKASANAGSTAAGKAAAPKLGGHRPPGFTPGKPSGPRPAGGPQLDGHRPPGFTPVNPSGPRPAGGPQLGGHRPPGFIPANPSGPRPAGGPQLGPQRPPPWQPARPSQPNKPPVNVWQPGKPSTQQRPQARPTLGSHRPPPEKHLTPLEYYRKTGYDALLEMLLSMPLSIPHQMAMELLPLTGIEEFGAPPEPQEEG